MAFQLRDEEKHETASDGAKIIFLSPHGNKTLDFLEHDQLGGAANANTISWLNGERDQRTTAMSQPRNINTKLDNNFDNKTVDGDTGGMINSEELEKLQKEKSELASKVMQLEASVTEFKEQLRAKEEEFSAKMQEKEKWVAEQKRNQLMRMRMLTEKISQKLKLNPDQAKLLKKF